MGKRIAGCAASLAFALALSACAGGALTRMPDQGEAALADARRQVANVSLPESRYPSRGETRSILRRVTERIRPIAADLCDEMMVADGFETLRSNDGPGRCDAIRRNDPIVRDSEEINAYVDQEHRMVFYSGLLEAAGTDDEVAAVMAHEYAHIVMGHVDKSVENQMTGALVGALVGAAVGAALEDADLAGSMVETGVALGAGAGLVFSPEMEMEADHLAVFILERSGYDIEAGRDFFIRMMRMKDRMSEARGQAILGFLRTHPADDARIAHWNATVRRVRLGQDAPEAR